MKKYNIWSFSIPKFASHRALVQKYYAVLTNYTVTGERFCFWCQLLSCFLLAKTDFCTIYSAVVRFSPLYYSFWCRFGEVAIKPIKYSAAKHLICENQITILLTAQKLKFSNKKQGKTKLCLSMKGKK